MSRKPIHMVNYGSDKISEALSFLDLIYLAGLNDKETACFSVGAQQVVDLLREAKMQLDNAATILRENAA